MKLVVDEFQKLNVKILAVSRLTNLQNFVSSFFRIHLEEDPKLQAISLITFNTNQLIESLGEAVKRERIADCVKLSPQAQLNIIALMNSANLSSADIARLIDNEIIYKDDVEEILEISKHTFRIDTPEIITDISKINVNILKLIKNKPALLHQITPRQFEELVGEMFYKDGFDVTLTQQTRDNGKDQKNF
ncbi:restriction endonuclease [Mucilaginibacter gossypii]|uniref:restriction endonuclease n=1 Tax=Mucilaginibacter gossypii TaxID=551996 RepID=UPI000DCD10D8|nr:MULTISPECIES: restriction endonuclease [Mucilaginibacter]QTE36496.1 restriction endonuclease [Mucilaginibacter gossypii]RAV48656.1 hypothetical protein DIU36_28145 [Mucilaginibacter rubeus]